MPSDKRGLPAQISTHPNDMRKQNTMSTSIGRSTFSFIYSSPEIWSKAPRKQLSSSVVASSQSIAGCAISATSSHASSHEFTITHPTSSTKTI